MLVPFCDLIAEGVRSVFPRFSPKIGKRWIMICAPFFGTAVTQGATEQRPLLLLWLLCCFSALVASVDFCCCLVYCAAFVAVQSALLHSLHTLVFHIFFSCANTLDREASIRFAHMYVMVTFRGGRGHCKVANLLRGTRRNI